MTRRKLGDLLIEAGLATPEQVAQALDHQRTVSKSLGAVLIDLGVVTEPQLSAVLATQQDVDSWDLEAAPPSPEAISKVPADICIKFRAIPVTVGFNGLTVAMANPGDVYAADVIQSLTRMPVKAVQAQDSQLGALLKELFGASAEESEESVDSFVSRALDEFAPVDSHEGGNDSNLTEEETRPVIGLVNQVIADAIDMRASDIHLEPRVDCLEIRYRVDGRLIKVREIPKALTPMVVARIKIMADMDVTDHRLPQDGRIEVKGGKKAIDLRVSVLPNYHGARIVLRVLDRAAVLKGLDDLGFNPHNLKIFRTLIEKPYGIILVTGPTGSGKTTTLYAALNELMDETTNIMTCEDPVEYDLRGINQSQVHEKIGLTFAAQLRAILRQDPDVVLVGEIRDKETAETAIRASLTGHLVLSTLHCNDAPSAIPRLLDMGIEPFLLSTSLIGIVAQRLLRVLCPHCRKLDKPSERDLEVMNSFGCEHVKEIWGPVGCPVCHGIGYSGRTAVHEILPIAEPIQRMIAARSPAEQIRDLGQKYGYRTMQQDSLARVMRGQTTFEEARRLIFFNTWGSDVTEESLPQGS